MKRKFLIIIYFICISKVCTQTCYHPFVDTVISHVSQQNINIIVRELSGDTTIITSSGEIYRILSRYWEHSGNEIATEHIFSIFQSYGYEPYYQNYSSTGTNVIAQKVGKTYPNQKIVICAHYDSYSRLLPGNDTVPGADDNASGSACVLEAARVLAQYDFDYTIEFVLFDEEEAGLWGSKAYVGISNPLMDSIICAINLDMIAWDGNNDYRNSVGTDTNSYFYSRVLLSSLNVYNPQFIPQLFTGGGGSDHVSFWQKGYKAVYLGEWSNDFNPYYHTQNETFNKFNQDYFLKMVKAAIAFLVVAEKDYIIDINHTPLQNTGDTSSRVVNAVVKSNRSIGTGYNAPRLYYKSGMGNFEYVNAYDNYLDTFKFQIPGYPIGSNISYYIAVQDAAGTLISSLPAGARGISPPGTIPPNNLFTYYITGMQISCSNTIPQLVLPRQTITNDITFNESTTIYDLNVNLTIYNPQDTNLIIQFLKPGMTMITLSSRHGGTGSNYINTTFDDEAVDSIKNGSPPFTGSYIPDIALSYFDNKELSGLWQLRITNLSLTDTAQLVSWCMQAEYYNPIGIKEISESPYKFKLYQNYPNPFNPKTKIKFSIPAVRDAYIHPVQLIVYDILGREIATLVNEQLMPGTYEIEWDASNYASGIYFYQLSTFNKNLSIEYIDTKRMVLIK